ncbi:hypothetical protein C8J57DRAFT_1228926 [Mycena rebaudengoi]|nr:hypothetical protein C8J57DRAFT_1228926 [Mycena rebaudengoi]
MCWVSTRLVRTPHFLREQPETEGKKNYPTKRRGVKAQGYPIKQPRTSQKSKGKVKVEEESAEENAEETDDGEFSDSQGPPNKQTRIPRKVKCGVKVEEEELDVKK